MLREAQELSNPGTASLLATYLTNTASMLDRIRRGDTVCAALQSSSLVNQMSHENLIFSCAATQYVIMYLFCFCF